ncbi:MAG: cupin domain-containing protein [Pseudomonadota bacterium]
MGTTLPTDLQQLLQFYESQRDNLPEEFCHGEGTLREVGFFSMQTFQQHLNNPLLRPEWVHIKTAGRDVMLDQFFSKKLVQRRPLQFIDKAKINEEIAKGGAIVLEGVDILDSSVNAFCGHLDNKLPCGLSNSVVFFSQHDNEAYSGHCDADDVLVVQLAGKKVWQLFEPQQRRYLGITNLSEQKLGPVAHEVEMNSGDALYVRAGVPHRCLTPDAFSLHMSFDLIDRTPGVDVISKEANRQYLQACELPYEPGSKVVDRYIELLSSPQFKANLSAETLQTRMELIEFRKELSRASGVDALAKFIQ